MAVSVFFALRNAIDAARSDAGNSEWFQMGNFSEILFVLFLHEFRVLSFSDCPGTIDKLHKMMLVKPEEFKFF